MEVDIGSVSTKDLGMATGSFDGQTLVGNRVALTSFDEGDVMINGQELAKFTSSTDDLEDLIQNINENVDNVTATGFNVVVAKQVGTGITTDGQFKIQVKALGATATTTYSISASANMQELVDNINNEAGAVVQASINDQGKLVLSNNTGATISVADGSSSTSGSYETASGFKRGATAAAYTSFAGFLKLDSDDGNPIRIEVGNRQGATPGSLTDLASLGFREVTSQYNKAQDAYSVTGTALTSAGVTTAWGQTDIKINGVAIYDADIDTNTFQGKLDAINNFSEQTGVIAYAQLDKTFTFTAGNLSGMTAGDKILFNGVEVFSLAGTSTTLAALATAINTKTGTTGITAEADGFNLRLTGTNVQMLRIDTTNTGGTAANTVFTDDEQIRASIRLDSATNTPISIELGDDATVAEHGFLEQNVGAADFQVNAASLGVGSGQSLTGLNISTASSATAAIATIDNAIEKVSSMRSKLGAMENRLNNTVNNLSNIVTNTQASRSRIQDTDYASETTALAKAQIISQAATAMLAQANQQPQSVLSLLK
jgi:flagellin